MRPVAETKNDLPIVEHKNQLAWERWLERNHERVQGVWVKFAKKDSGKQTVNYAQALESALCFGWIDGQAARYDELYYLQRFTPRRKRSQWSQNNVNKATELIAQNRMRPAGLRAIEQAKADGRWDAAYPAQSDAPIPPDFEAALKKNPTAKAFFDTLTGSTRYAFLYRLHNTRTDEARARRINDYIERLSERRTLT
jgi:uncharacterized protein YdeI (YjbR/CyaY-like superfamily)